MTATRVRAILFDLDGTLADSEHQTDAAIAAVMARRGHASVVLAPAETRGRTWGDITQTLASRYALDATGLDVALAEEWAQGIDAMVPIPGARAAVHAAAECFAVAVVSSSPRALVDRLLVHLGIAGAVSIVVGGDEVVRPKPDPEGFLRAAERLAVAPSECVVFEDSRAGLEAARSAGMASVLVRLRCDEPDHCRPLAMGSVLHFEASPSTLWSLLSTEGPRVLRDLE